LGTTNCFQRQTIDLGDEKKAVELAESLDIPIVVGAINAMTQLREGQQVTIDVTNHTDADEIVHWHGLFLRLQLRLWKFCTWHSSG
jgi:hypothetical protein